MSLGSDIVDIARETWGGRWKLRKDRYATLLSVQPNCYLCDVEFHKHKTRIWRDLKPLPTLGDVLAGREEAVVDLKTWRKSESHAFAYPTLDHVDPYHKSQKEEWNILLACNPCNNEKGGRDPYPCELLYLEAINLALELQRDIRNDLMVGG